MSACRLTVGSLSLPTLSELHFARFQRAVPQVAYRPVPFSEFWAILEVRLQSRHIGWVVRDYADPSLILVNAAPVEFHGVPGWKPSVWHLFPVERLWWTDPRSSLPAARQVLRIITDLDHSIDID